MVGDVRVIVPQDPFAKELETRLKTIFVYF
jgi:hypothetical protein